LTGVFVSDKFRLSFPAAIEKHPRHKELDQTFRRDKTFGRDKPFGVT
jgi:hypothetical protein